MACLVASPVGTDDAIENVLRTYIASAVQETDKAADSDARSFPRPSFNSIDQWRIGREVFLDALERSVERKALTSSAGHLSLRNYAATNPHEMSGFIVGDVIDCRLPFTQNWKVFTIISLYRDDADGRACVGLASTEGQEHCEIVSVGDSRLALPGRFSSPEFDSLGRRQGVGACTPYAVNDYVDVLHKPDKSASSLEWTVGKVVEQQPQRLRVAIPNLDPNLPVEHSWISFSLEGMAHRIRPLGRHTASEFSDFRLQRFI